MPEIVKWLARRRVAIGFVAGAVALWLAQPTPYSLAIGALVATFGEAVRIWAAGHLEKGREVTTSGPYRLTRHPLYAGSTFVGLGLAIAAASWMVGTLIVAYLAITLTAAIASEEAHLTQKFGEAYPAYRQGRAEAAARRFSLERALRNREYRAVIGVLAVLSVLAWKALA
jgi:protein-S-isoprenylcysteine O-methyltransferase Ste14